MSDMKYKDSLTSHFGIDQKLSAADHHSFLKNQQKMVELMSLLLTQSESDRSLRDSRDEYLHQLMGALQKTLVVYEKQLDERKALIDHSQKSPDEKGIFDSIESTGSQPVPPLTTLNNRPAEKSVDKPPLVHEQEEPLPSLTAATLPLKESLPDALDKRGKPRHRYACQGDYQ